jgi:hypothetical protein
MGKNSSISQRNAGVRGIQPRGYLSGKLSVKDCNHRYSRNLFATLCSRYRGWWRKEPMEKGLKVKRHERCSVVPGAKPEALSCEVLMAAYRNAYPSCSGTDTSIRKRTSSGGSRARLLLKC